MQGTHTRVECRGLRAKCCLTQDPFPNLGDNRSQKMDAKLQHGNGQSSRCVFFFMPADDCSALGVAHDAGGSLVALPLPPSSSSPPSSVAVCLTGQPRSFHLAFSQWSSGPLLPYLRSLGRIDWFVVATRSGSYNATAAMMRSLNVKQSFLVERLDIAHDGSMVEERLRQSADEAITAADVRLNVMAIGDVGCNAILSACRARGGCRHSHCRGSNVHTTSALQLWQMSKCGELIERHEQKQGAQYRHAARLRFDTVVWRTNNEDAGEQLRACKQNHQRRGQPAVAGCCRSAMQALAERRQAQCRLPSSSEGPWIAALRDPGDFIAVGSRSAMAHMFNTLQRLLVGSLRLYGATWKGASWDDPDSPFLIDPDLMWLTSEAMLRATFGEDPRLALLPCELTAEPLRIRILPPSQHSASATSSKSARFQLRQAHFFPNSLLTEHLLQEWTELFSWADAVHKCTGAELDTTPTTMSIGYGDTGDLTKFLRHDGWH